MAARIGPQAATIIESVVFIHAGGLHGDAVIATCGFSSCARSKSGMMYASSCAIENSDRSGSVSPGGTSSYE
jgi:hypothetical protein